MAEIAVDNPAHPPRRAQRDICRVATRDSRNKPVGMSQIESRIEAKCHDACRRFCCADSGQHSKNTLVVQAQMMEARVERQDLVKMRPLYPVLIFAGRVARVLAGLIHGDDNYLDRNWLGWRGINYAGGKKKQ